ncbi:MAG: carboxypeptidase-like regulatory domain-containing protein, partial [Candidatus Atribacteria bacterium]|nr:carboxypeptidase-like regulatory domain-containing protein [Candidatus Atribacteria bacterium]
MLKKKYLLFFSLLLLGFFLFTSCLPRPPVTEGILKGRVMVPEELSQAKQLTGQALVNALFNIIDPITGNIIATTTTDANGYYRGLVLPGGPYLLQVVKEGMKVQQVTPPVEVGKEYD